jgi:hypothetical protein
MNKTLLSGGQLNCAYRGVCDCRANTFPYLRTVDVVVRLWYLCCAMLLIILQVLTLILNLASGALKLWQTLSEKKKSHSLLSRLQEELGMARNCWAW